MDATKGSAYCWANCCDRAPRCRYKRKVVDALLNGGMYSELANGWIDTTHYLELRAGIERSGNVESDAFATVIDLERAVTALQSYHPNAAAVLACVAWLDMDAHDLQRAFGGRTNWVRVQMQATAWMTGFLQGLPISDPDSDVDTCERRYDRAGKSWRRAR